jgi:glycosyltransferase involved in cell wall biosynthesis
MRIAILGTRGIPANYGGFETFAQECALRLVARGHDVTVYARSHHVPEGMRSWRGVRIVVLPTLRFKYTDTVVHAFLSTVHSLFCSYDVILMCNSANSLFTCLPRLFGTPVAVNVDGIERKRGKWNALGRAYYRLSETLSVWFPNVIVTDALVIQRYYREHHGADSVFIPYGANVDRPSGKDVLERLGLASRSYFLYVSRLEPENNAHVVVAAFERIRSDRRLVVVGDAPYSQEYIAKLRSTRDRRILFAGGVYGEGYVQLQANALCYIHATEVGGTHPALIEAMGQGGLVIANGTPENIEVLGGAGLIYEMNDVGDLVRRLQEVEDDPARFEARREAARDRVAAHYSWDAVVSSYENLLASLAAPGR